MKLYQICEDDLNMLARFVWQSTERLYITNDENRWARDILNNVRNNYEDSPAPKPEIPELKPTPYPIDDEC